MRLPSRSHPVLPMIVKQKSQPVDNNKRCSKKTQQKNVLNFLLDVVVVGKYLTALKGLHSSTPFQPYVV